MAWLHGRPLLDSRVDMALYLPRPRAETAIRRALTRGLNVLVEGSRGSGRTTLIRALLFRSRTQEPSSGRPMHYLRASTATSAAELVQLLATRVLDEPASPPAGRPLGSTPDAGPERGVHGSEDDLLGLADDGASALDQLTRLRRRLEATQPDGPRHIVCLDDVDPRVGNQFFGVLRDEVWELPIQWIVTTTPDDAAILLLPPADAFFETRVDLGFLSRQEVAELIEKRLGHPVELPEGTGEWTPREALDLARLAPEDWASALDERQRRDEQVARLGRPATMLVAAMEELGPVSPSDDRLLARTGWTSSRVSQVLRQLLDVGLVAYREVRGDRPGRPARLYELRPLRG